MGFPEGEGNVWRGGTKNDLAPLREGRDFFPIYVRLKVSPLVKENSARENAL